MFALYHRNRLVHLAAILLSAFLFTTLAIYNGFPFLFNNDTVVYIEGGFTHQVRPDRPIVYGLFINVASMHYSLWLVVIVQAMIVSLALYFVFKYGSKNAGNGHLFLAYYLLFSAFVCFFMGASFEACWLMPDVFIAVTILCITLLVFFKLKKRDLIIISIMLVLSIMVHNSHFFICLLLCCLLLTGFIFRRIRLLYSDAGVKVKSILFAMALSVVSSLLSAGIHYKLRAGFRSSFGGATFFISNLIEMGVVDPYLAENCGKYNYKLCAYKDSLPNDFLWVSNSPFKKTGGWGKRNQVEFAAIEKDLLTTPRYLTRIIYRSGIYTCKLFFSYDMEHVKVPSAFVNKIMKKYYDKDYEQFSSSRQSTGRMQFGFLEFAQNIAVGLSCLFYCIIGLHARRDRKLLLITCFVLAALISNAWFCSTFSGVYSRYQTRVVWLLPLPLFLYGLKYRGWGIRTGKNCNSFLYTF